MPWIKFKARPAVSNTLSHEVMHELSRCLPVGQRHGVSSGSFVPLQLVLVVLPMWPQHLGHVACSFGVGPQVVAGLQQVQPARGDGLPQIQCGILSDPIFLKTSAMVLPKVFFVALSLSSKAQHFCSEKIFRLIKQADADGWGRNHRPGSEPVSQ